MCTFALSARRWTLAVALLLVSCDDKPATTEQATTKPTKPTLSATAQSLLEQLVTLTSGAAGRALTYAGPEEAVAVYSVIGVNTQRGADAHLAMQCAAETKPSGPTCHSALPGQTPYLDLFDTCFVTGCTGAKQSYVDVYITAAPLSAPDDRAPITYPMTAPFPPGTVTYDPNPLTRWWTDATDPNAVHVRAELDANVRVAVEGETDLDFSYEGVVEGTNANNVRSLTLDLHLPNLIRSEPVQVSMQHFDDKPTLGKIIAGDVTLADIVEDSIIWQKSH
ncbi:MAG TPA: hypothetical protein VJV78_39015 [Polyangiales bacterium]|nr:hypothetical protein [Polyangiales bacterium]